MRSGEVGLTAAWALAAGLAAALAGACGQEKQSDDGGGDDGLYDGSAGDEGADGADAGGSGAEGGTGAVDGDDWSDGGDGGLDEGGTTGSSDGGWDDGAPDDGGDGSVSPTPAWVPDLAVSCADGLDFQLHVLDARGAPCTDDCDGAQIWLGGAIVNPCDVPYIVVLDGGMVISGGSAEGPDGTGMGWGAGSDGTVREVEVAPGAYLTAAEDLGSLSPGDWSFGISFADREGHSASTTRTLR